MQDITVASVLGDAAQMVTDLGENGRGCVQSSAVHQRSADRLLWLCYRNKGLYIKLGQYLSTLHHAIPQEYLRTLKVKQRPFLLARAASHERGTPTVCIQVLQDHAPFVDYFVVQQVIEEDLGAKPEELFLEFDKVPLAAASLAQVFLARTRS